MDYLIPVIIASQVDNVHAQKIVTYLSKYENIIPVIRICSAHKAPKILLSMLEEYENNNNVYVYITIAGKSNALSALVDGNTVKPVISCPPLKHESMYDIYSSTSMPSEISPMLVLNPVNAAFAVLKILGNQDTSIRNIVKDIHNKNKQKLNIEDVKSMYKYTTKNKYNKMLTTLLSIESTENLSFLQKQSFKKGKIRDLYNLTDNIFPEEEEYYSLLSLCATDRLSGFDRYLCDIPFKGCVLNSISGWWFEKTKHIVKNHIINSNYCRHSIVEKCNVIPIEFVVRGYMTGSTQTSIWQNYLKGSRMYCGNQLREGYTKNDKLDNIIITPTTKSDIHDELISPEDIVSREIMTQNDWNTCKTYALSLFQYGQKICKEKGLILVDTKYEFGKTETGNIILIDEIHTPDSSRFWFSHNYLERHTQGEEPDYIDKEFIRKWVKKTYINPYEEGLEINIPEEMVYELSLRYLILHKLITGEDLLSGNMPS